MDKGSKIVFIFEIWKLPALFQTFMNSLFIYRIKNYIKNALEQIQGHFYL